MRAWALSRHLGLIACSTACSGGDDGEGQSVPILADAGAAVDMASSADIGFITDLGETEDLGGPTPFTVGRFDERWAEDESVLMYMGFGLESCALYEAPDGDRLESAVVRDPGFPEFNEAPSWQWSLLDVDGNQVRSERFTEPEARTLRLLSRSVTTGLEERTLSFFFGTEAPVFVRLDEDFAPVTRAFTTEDVGAFEDIFVRNPNGGGSGSGRGLPSAEHVFSTQRVATETPRGAINGTRFDHDIDGVEVASYVIVPAWGIMSFDQNERTYTMCDFRLCTSTGCEGATSCSALSCGP